MTKPNCIGTAITPKNDDEVKLLLENGFKMISVGLCIKTFESEEERAEFDKRWVEMEKGGK